MSMIQQLLPLLANVIDVELMAVHTDLTAALGDATEVPTTMLSYYPGCFVSCCVDLYDFVFVLTYVVSVRFSKYLLLFVSLRFW